MNCQNTPPSQRGFTALELIIVLIIGFSIIGLSASKMAEMMDSSKSVRAMDSIVSLSTAIKALSGPEGYGASGEDLIEPLIKSGTAPKSLKTKDNKELINQWNAAVEAKVHGQDSHKFTIQYPSVPKSACNKLVKDLLTNFTVSIATGTATNLVSDSSTRGIINACDVGKNVKLVLEDL